MEPENFIVTSDLLASRMQRFLNWIIDIIIIMIIDISIIATVYIVGQMTNNFDLSDWIRENIKILQPIGFFVVSLLYYSITEIYFERTVAKYITKTLVVMKDGSSPDTMRIIKRTLCRWIPFEPFSFFNKDARGWHDTLTRTFVVKKHEFNNRKGHAPFYG